MTPEDEGLFDILKNRYKFANCTNIYTIKPWLI